jgi:hypothetical protein
MANTVGTPAIAGMLAKVVKQQYAGRQIQKGHCMLTSEMTAAAGRIETITAVNSRRETRNSAG